MKLPIIKTRKHRKAKPVPLSLPLNDTFRIFATHLQKCNATGNAFTVKRIKQNQEQDQHPGIA